jgi:hypothetical protein
MNDEPCGAPYEGGECGWIAGHVADHGPGPHSHPPFETCDRCQGVGADLPDRAVQPDPCEHNNVFQRMVLMDGETGVECMDCREAFAISPAYEARRG